MQCSSFIMMLNSLNICPQVAFLTAVPCYILTIKARNLELAAPAGCSIHWCRTGEKIWSLQWNIASQAWDNIQSKFAKKRGGWGWLILKKGHGIWPCQSKFGTLHCIVWIEGVKVNGPVSYKDACLAALFMNGQKQRPARHCVRWHYHHGDAGGLWIGLHGVTGY